MPKEIKKYGSADVTKLMKKFSTMSDEKLKDIYANIDWDDYRMIDVAVLAGEIGLRGWEIVEADDPEDKNVTILEFKAKENMKNIREDKVA